LKQPAHQSGLAEKFFHNRVFNSLDALEDHLTLALKSLEDDPNTVDSIVSWPWIIGALLRRGAAVNAKRLRQNPNQF